MSLVALRVGSAHWVDEDALKRFRSFMRKYPGVIDEIVLFDHTTHAPLPYDEMTSRMRRLAHVIPQIRNDGFRVGINVLTTIGHHEEHEGYSLEGPYQRVVDLEGRECRGCYCPNDPGFEKYVVALYEAAAAAKPDFIWVDDDVRLMGHMPIRETCFCEFCLERFAELAGRTYTRSELRRAFSGEENPGALEMRRMWLEHNRRTIDRLLSVVEKTVHAKDPAIELGFMTGDRPYEGYAFGRWAKTLAGETGPGVRWRPGGGFYSDGAPLEMVHKSHDVGRQCSALPESVRMLQSEIENFPYQPLRKSAYITALEAASHIAAGTTGAAFNILNLAGDPLDEYAPFLAEIKKRKPFYRALVDAFGRSPVSGVWPAWNDDTFAANSVRGAWFDAGDAWGDLRRSYALAEVGIPLCYAPADRCVTLLAGNAPYAFSGEELEDMFRGGVLLDGKALTALHDLGLGDLTGVRVEAVIHKDAVEVLEPHLLNGAYAGYHRDCRQSFWPEPAYALTPLAPGVERLGRLENFAGGEIGLSCTVFVNRLGGRVAVSGYYPWTQIYSAARAAQLKELVDWLSGGRVPIVVESFAKVVPWARKTETGYAYALLNANWDPLVDVSVRVAGDHRSWTLLDQDQSRFSLSGTPIPDRQGYLRLTIPEMKPWSMYLLTPSPK